MIKPSEVLMLFQNTWHPEDTPPAHMVMYANDEKYRKLHFSRSMSGGRILKAFGAEFYAGVHMNNANPEATFNSRGVKMPDLDYVDLCVQNIKPKLLVAFGLQARLAVSLFDLPQMYCRHPNAMGILQEELNLFALQVKLYCRDEYLHYGTFQGKNIQESIT